MTDGTSRGCSIAALVVVAWRGAGVRSDAESLPALTDTVNDFANVIDAQSARELDRRIRALHDDDEATPSSSSPSRPSAVRIDRGVRGPLFEQAGIGTRRRTTGC